MHSVLTSNSALRAAILVGPMAALLTLAAPSALADIISSSADLRLLSGDPNVNDPNYLSLYNDGGGNVQRTFLNFNLSSYSGKSVTTDATLTLVALNFGDVLTGASLGTANSAWTGAGITWNNQPGLTAISGATNPSGNFPNGSSVTWTIPWYMVEKLATTGSGYNNGFGITSGVGSTLHFQATGGGGNPTLAFSAATAASSTWTGSNGNWTDTANWAGSTIAQGIDQAATINGGTAVNITMDANRSVGSLSFSGANHTISAGAGKLALNVTTGAPTVTVETGRTATIGATLVGIDGLTKNGNGTLTFTTANTYTGATTVNAGTLKVTYNGGGNGGVGTLGAGSSITVNSGGTLLGSAFNGLGYASTHAGDLLTINKDGALTVDAGIVLSMPYALNVVGGTISSVDGGDPSFGTIFYQSTMGTFTSAIDGTAATISAQNFNLQGPAFNVTNGNGAVDLNVTGNLIGGGPLTKNGNGTMVLTGANSYTGTTTVAAGTLQIGNAAVNGVMGSGAHSIAAGAKLFLNYATAAAPAWSQITGAGTLSLSTAATFDYGWGQTALTAGFSGTLQLEKGRAYGRPTDLGGTTAVVIGNGAQFLAFDGTGNGTAYTFPQNLSINGIGYGESGHDFGAIRVSGMNATFSGNLTLAGNSGLYTQTAANATLNATGVISDGGAGYGLAINAASNPITFGGGSSNTYTGITNVNTGVLVLSKTGGAKAISGNIVFGNGSASINPYIRMTQDSQFGPSSTVTFTNNIGGYTRFELQGTSQTLAGISDSIGAGVIQNSESGVGGAGVLTINNTSDYSYTGYLRNGSSGTLALFKSGVGTQTLAGGNINYTGATTINAGTLKVTFDGGGNGGVGTLGVGSGITVNSGGTLLGSAFNALGHSSTHAGDLLTINKGGALTVDAGVVLSMPYALNVVGGTISSVDGGHPSYGTIFYGSTMGTFTSHSDGTAATISAQNFGLQGAQFNVVQGGGPVDLNVTGNLIGGGPLVKNGNGVMALTTANTYTGATIINDGTLKVTYDGGGNGGVGTLGVGSGITVNSGGTLLGGVFNGLGYQTTHAGDLLTINKGGALRVDAGVVLSMPYALNVVGGTISSVDGGFSGLGTIYYASTQGTFTSHSDGTAATISAQKFNLQGAQFNVVQGGGAVDLNVTGNLIGGGLVKNGNGVMVLAGANTYGGQTSITAGTLVAANNTALGIGGHNGDTMTFIQDGATLAMQGGISLDEHFHVWGSGVGSLGAVRSISGNNALTNAPGGAPGYALRSNTTVGVAADTLTVSGFYNGDGGSYGITKIGAGTLTLTTANTYTGATLISGGTLMLGNGGTTGSLSTSSNITNNGTLNLNHSDNIVQGSAFGNLITGSGKLVQSGAGITKLTSMNDFLGDTDVTAGTLEAGAADALKSTANVNVSGGTLLLSGSGNRVNDNAKITLSGGTLNTGGLSETMGVLSVGSNSVIDLGSGASSVTFANTDTWAGVLAVWNYTGGIWDAASGDKLFFIANTGSVAPLTQLHFYSDNGVTEIGTGGGFFSGSTGQLVPVPESSALGACGALLGFLGFRHRRSAVQQRKLAEASAVAASQRN